MTLSIMQLSSLLRKFEKMNACPFCNSNELIKHAGPVYFIKCETCDAEGPSGKDSEEALEKWNTASRKREEELCDTSLEH